MSNCHYFEQFYKYQSILIEKYSKNVDLVGTTADIRDVKKKNPILASLIQVVCVSPPPFAGKQLKIGQKECKV